MSFSRSQAVFFSATAHNSCRSAFQPRSHEMCMVTMRLRRWLQVSAVGRGGESPLRSRRAWRQGLHVTGSQTKPKRNQNQGQQDHLGPAAVTPKRERANASERPGLRAGRSRLLMDTWRNLQVFPAGKVVYSGINTGIKDGSTTPLTSDPHWAETKNRVWMSHR